MDIVLHEPEIASNAGNIGRTCAAAGVNLHLIRPLGFFVDDKAVRRAGMDYWSELNVRYYDSFDEFLSAAKPSRILLATTKTARIYTDARYFDDSFIVFGKESAGLPDEIRSRYPGSCVRIPMAGGARSLNLSNAAAIILYEAMRQTKFKGLT
ncbi:MAG: tRNA (cytidine(34)-2'-O)-methyltransferase [Defluviitaleaceae bacterium]|nr:tRNA (cytidine(34)-2'-O)-methyltransferase [Defluviitaleaceae bacterium]